MTTIHVSHLSKVFKLFKKEPGIMGSTTSLFSRKYRDFHAVSDISFDISEGELVGFIGPNGAGKTTTLKMLSGLLYPSSGVIEVAGFTPFDRKPAFLKNISLMMGQKNQLWWDLPPMESFLLNKEIYAISEKHFRDVLGELVSLMGVEDIVKVQVRNLSLGQRMKCELIAQLLHSPKVLFLDEPTIGLDVVMQQKFRQYIKEYNKRYRATIILTSHYMDDVKELCKRVIVIDHGTLLFDGSLDDVIRKYSKHKLITVTYSDSAPHTSLRTLGNVLKEEDHMLQIEVPREHSNDIAARILKEFQIIDLNIEEPPIEEIIRSLFTSEHIRT